MARLWSSGFELNSTTAGVEFTTVTNGSISTTTFRSGTYAGRISSLASATARGYEYQFAAAAGNGPYYARFYINVATLPSAANTIFTFNNTTGLVGTPEASIKLDNTGAFSLFNGLASQVGSASSTITTGTWHYIEVWFDASGAVGADTLKARLDGVEFASATNLTILAGVLAMTFGGNLNAEVQTTGDWFFDDIAVNDGSGASQTTYPGSGSILHLRPNADGDNHQQNTPGPTAGTANNYQQVDEVTPNDATDNIEGAGNGKIDDYNIDATPAAIDATAVINTVQVGWRYRSEGVGTGDSFAVRIKKASGGTLSTSSTITPSGTTWVTNANAAPRNYPLTLYADPDASAWTKATLDTAQIGLIQKDAAGANATDVSTEWLLVDYSPTTTVSVTVSDTVTLTESVAELITSSVNVNDTVTLSESIGRLVLSFVSVSDLVTLSEAISVQPTSFINVSDSISVSDTVQTTSAANTSVSDSVTVSESVSHYSDLILVREQIELRLLLGYDALQTMESL